MKSVTIEEIKRDPIQYLNQVEAGETLLITRSNQPVAELRPVPGSKKGLRPIGLCSGQFTIPDDFDAPLPQEIIDSSYGE